jgi:hypothetical protein
MPVFLSLLQTLRTSVRSRVVLQLEVLALRHQLERLPTLVGLEESAPPGTTDRVGGRSHLDSHDGIGEPALGRTTDSRPATETRDRRVSGHRREIYGAPAPASVAEVACLLANHIGQIVAADFFAVPTATYRLLFVVVLLAHDRRRIGTSRSPRILRRRGRPNSCARPFRATRCLDT